MILPVVQQRMAVNVILSFIPAEAQRQLAGRIMGFWQEGYGANYNPDRQEAFSRVKIAKNLTEVYAEIEAEQGVAPLKVATDARKYANTVTYAQLRKDIETKEVPILLLFGTGWGLLKEDVEQMDQILEPIYGPTDYNHFIGAFCGSDYPGPFTGTLIMS